MELLLVLGILGVFLGLALPLLSPNRLALDQAARSFGEHLKAHEGVPGIGRAHV